MMLMTYKKSSVVQAIKITRFALCLDKAISNIATGVQAPPRQLLLHRLGNRSLRCSTSCMTRRDVVAAIAPGDLAAFPPSLEVNADIAGADICPCIRKAPIFGACTCRQSLRSGTQQLPYLTTA